MINKSFVAVSLILALAISFNFFNKVSYANEESTPAVEVQSKQLDDKAEILSSYLSKHNSPLQYHSQDFIDAAKQYNLDWKLVPAIAGVESTFGKHIPGGYNGWGWGVYGDQALGFESWTKAIFTISKGLRENYVDKGLTDPYEINKVYAASQTWGEKVTYFMKDLEDYEKEFTFSQDNKDLSHDLISSETAAVSAELVLR